MDSVNLINAGKPKGLSEPEWQDQLDRNKRHLEIMIAKDFWTTEDLQPFRDAIENSNLAHRDAIENSNLAQ
jgi:hypothetical protein